MDATAGETAQVSQTAEPGRSTADTGGGREARAPEGPSGAGKADIDHVPANARERQTRPETQVAIAQAKRLGNFRPAPQIDYARVAEAHRRATAAQPAPPPARPRALPVAMGPEACRRCGVPGFRGCAHQAPYEEWTPAAARRDLKDTADKGQARARRKGGKHATRL